MDEGKKRTEAAQNEEGRWRTTWGTKSTMAWFTLIDNYSVISEEKRHRPNLVCNHFLLIHVLQSNNNIMHTKQGSPAETLGVICMSVTVIHLQTAFLRWEMPVLASLGGNLGIPVNLDSPDTCQLNTRLTHGNRDPASRLAHIYSAKKIKDKHKDGLTPFWSWGFFTFWGGAWACQLLECDSSTHTHTHIHAYIHGHACIFTHA